MAKKVKSDNKQEGPRSIQNRRARYDYEFLDTYEAGVALVGSEVKSMYLGRANLADAYCKVVGDELWIINMDIEPYTHSSVFQPERRRDRKLLLNRRELDTIQRRSMEKGLTIIPIKAYFNNRGRVKIEIGLGRGKKEYDKRDQIAKDEARRDMERLRSEKF